MQARALAGWTVVGDLSAGPRQSAFDWAPYAETFLLAVVEPSWKSVLTARTIARIARSRGGTVAAVANTAEGVRDARWLARAVGEPVVATLPRDEAVREEGASGWRPWATLRSRRSCAPSPPSPHGSTAPDAAQVRDAPRMLHESARPSPSRLSARMVSASAAPGNTDVHHAAPR